jgi:hypothetical protein
MPIYAKNLSPEWRKAFERYESLCGFEPMHQDEIDSGEMTARDAWNENVRWLECVCGDVQNTQIPDDDCDS